MPSYRASPPSGYEDACEPDPNGWPVWKKTKDGSAPCANEACEEPYDETEPNMALQCPVCEQPGCSACFYSGRGCPCPDCEEG